MKKSHLVILGILVLSFAFILAACSAPQASVGPAGPAGPQGEPGPAGKDGAPGKDYVPQPGAGLVVEIKGVEFPKDGNPVVTLKVTDAKGVNLPAASLEGSGFTIAQLLKDETTQQTRFQSLLVHPVDGKPYQDKGKTIQPVMKSAVQAYADSGGKWAEKEPGVLTYTFQNALSSPVDPKRLTVVGVYAWKENRAAVANDVFTFLPEGGVATPEREIVTAAACQTCHNPLQAHGGLRRDPGLCVTCHTDQTVDPETGNNLELKVMVHKLHFGQHLPSVQAGKPYEIVGYRQTLFDFSKDSWPQDVRYCITCHSGGMQSSNFKMKPNTAACTSCHDSTNVSTGDNHPGGIQTDDQCSTCHAPDSSAFDASVTGAHTIPLNSKEIKQIRLKIVSVTGVKAGGSPVIQFTVSNSAGEPVDPAKMGYLAVTLAGPTSDYTNRWTEQIVAPNAKTPPEVRTAKDGSFEYQMKAQIPSTATGTYAVSMEGYVMEEISGSSDPVRVAAFNPVVYTALDGGQPVARRQVIDQNKCNVCHMTLTMHGTIRQNTEYCVLCHNATATDEAMRPADAMPPTTINFAVLVHRIHRGEEGRQPLQVYGYGNNLHDYSSVIFPGSLKTCTTCHLPGTYNLPLQKGLLPTTITQEGKEISSTLPVRAVCTSCHDGPETGGHADLQTTADKVETCLVCHGPNREFDVSKSHQ